MKLLNNNLGENREIENTQFFFERTFRGFSLRKVGFDVAFLTEVTDFTEFEENGEVYAVIRVNNESYGIYRFSNRVGRPERIVSISGGKRFSSLPDRFCVELKMNENYYFLSNLEFDTNCPKKTRVTKFKSKRYIANDFSINVGDSDVFASLMIFEGSKVISYEKV